VSIIRKQPEAHPESLRARQEGKLATAKFIWIGWPAVLHAVRTAVVAVAALLVAQLLRLPASYWAPISALVVTQSSLGATLKVSTQRLIGTVLGAAAGGLVATFFPPQALAFGLCIFILGLLCAILRADHPAYRFAGITVAIVLLAPRTEPAWQIAVHRFAEVAIGLVVALLFTWAWPEKESARQPN
jgi:uncharacterized membrane protein YccC